MKHTFKLSTLLLAMAATLPSVVIAATVDAQLMGYGVQTAPVSIRAVVPLLISGTAPSSMDAGFIGARLLLTKGKINQALATVTLPLYKVTSLEGETYWYVLTDSNDAADAKAKGLNFSSKLNHADIGRGMRHATQQADGSVTLMTGNAGVDFSPVHSITAGDAPNFFPPKAFTPGSVGAINYSPLMQIHNGAVANIYNAPIVAKGSVEQLNAFCNADADKSMTHDKVRRICPSKGTVELQMTLGFTSSRPVWYISLDANMEMPATMEQVTFAPALQDIEVDPADPALSAVEDLFAVTNGPMGKTSPQRQGFNSALSGEGSPLNILGTIPTSSPDDYSPLWSVYPVEWTAKAIANSYRSRVGDKFEILGLVKQGWLTGPGGADFHASGFIVNCPPVMRLF